MDFELQALDSAGAAQASCDLLLVLASEAAAQAAASKPHDALCATMAQALDAGDWQPGSDKQLALYRVDGVAARRVLLLGAGSGSAKDVRKAIAGAAGALKAPGTRQALLHFAWQPAPEAIAAAVLGAADACYRYTHTKPQAKPVALQHLLLGVPDPATASGAGRRAFDVACAQAAGMTLAREWANRPANHATPTDLAEAAQALAAAPAHNMRCTIHGPEEVERLGMGAFIAVAQGSAQPLRLIELHYSGAGSDAPPVVLVGKGITFDSGGISIKPAAGMDEMKFDMGGAASVLGVFQALARLQPALNVVGLIAACENLPGPAAVKPGDVVTSMSGQTIEILNTDAEGRLVLCDALTYAERFKPAAVVDIATLTGACVIALGHLRSGMFASSDALAHALQQAGDAALDPCWRMPLDEEYGEELKSNFGDVPNVAGRAAGTVTAAKFLQRFVGETDWAHLDIAGTAWKSGGSAKGATGRPVGLLLHWLLARAGHV